MKNIEIDTFKIGLLELATPGFIRIVVTNTAGETVATSMLSRSSTMISFTDSRGVSSAPSLETPLDLFDEKVNWSQCANRSLFAGAADPIAAIVDAAYMFVQTKIAPTYQDPSLDVERDVLVLSASSTAPISRTQATPRTKANRKTGAARPRRRKGDVKVWI